MLALGNADLRNYLCPILSTLSVMQLLQYAAHLTVHIIRCGHNQHMLRRVIHNGTFAAVDLPGRW